MAIRVSSRWVIFGVAGALFALSCALVVTSITGCGDAPPASGGDDGKQAGLVVLGYVDLKGGVLPLTFERPGRIRQVFAVEDQPVKAGDPLLATDDALAEQTVAEAEAALAAAQAQLEQARQFPTQKRRRIEQQQASIDAMDAKVAAARQNAALKKTLQSLQQASAEEVAVAEAQLAEAQAGLRAQQLKLEELEAGDNRAEIKRLEALQRRAEASLEQAKINKDAHTLRAPTDGKCLRILAGPGEVASPARPVVRFAPQSERIVRAEVSQGNVGRVSVGDAVEIVDEVDPSLTYSGKVISISDWFAKRRAVLEETPIFTDVLTVECLISIEASADRPPPRIGQRVRVKIK